MVVDFYLDDKRQKERAEIVTLSNDNRPEAWSRLTGYVREALRLHPQVSSEPNFPVSRFLRLLFRRHRASLGKLRRT